MQRSQPFRYILSLIALSLCLWSPVHAEGAAVDPDAGTMQEGHQAYASGDFKKSLELWKPLAEKGNVQAQFYLSTLYSNGEGVEQDIFSALSWLTSSAQAGYAPAQFNLGNRYYHGRWVEQDRLRAAQWWRKAAEQGVPQAAYNLGSLYYHGQGLKQNRDEATRWYRKAAEAGSEEATKVLAKLEEAKPAPVAPAAKGKVKARAESSTSSAKAAPVEVPTPSETPPASSVVKVSTPAESVEWIKSQPEKNLTIQVYAANQLGAVERFIKNFNASDRIAVFGFVRDNKPMYAVIQGSYPTKAEADAGTAKLTGASSWLRSFGSVRKIMVE
ncbi:MAG: SEL1-like repeat protein [Gammaproteobacteria bacterium]|nr:SEL1-like repeat protein [Gammaproteobacteria bacterium]MBU1655610.1 SEL1-like repeat protein [Gammaproteobacteria bacterium]MBU1962282.1 SEL1-like repeat protein [Gammaproteobacteria bacterium]